MDENETKCKKYKFHLKDSVKVLHFRNFMV